MNNVLLRYNVAVCLHTGEGMAEDMTRAVDIYQMVADKGHAGAQYNFGIAHSTGLGPLKSNPVLGFEYLERSANQRYRHRLMIITMTTTTIDVSTPAVFPIPHLKTCGFLTFLALCKSTRDSAGMRRHALPWADATSKEQAVRSITTRQLSTGQKQQSTGRLRCNNG